MSSVPNPSAGTPDRAFNYRPTPRALSQQDRAMAAALVSASRLMNRVIGDFSLASALESEGYDVAELQAGVTLHMAAEEVFGACQQSLGELDHAQREFDASWVNAREEYLEFRWLARRTFTDAHAQQVLQVLGTVSDDVNEFIAQAVVSYRASQLLHSPQPLPLPAFGAERIQSALAELRCLARLDHAVQAARARAERHREERDLALAMLNLWMRDFQRAACGALDAGRDARPPAGSLSLRRRKQRTAHDLRAARCPRFPARFSVRFPRSRGRNRM